MLPQSLHVVIVYGLFYIQLLPALASYHNGKETHIYTHVQYCCQRLESTRANMPVKTEEGAAEPPFAPERCVQERAC